MNANENPKALLEALCTHADPRKTRSLRLIYAICEEQLDRGSKDYSVATIGRLSAERGGPAVGAIRNKTGEAYRAVITAFADSVGCKIRKAVDAKPIPADLILHGVTDPVLRARIGLLLAELKSKRAQLLAARHLANQNAVLDMERELSDGGVNCAAAAPHLSPLEIRALENAISKVTLTHWAGRCCGTDCYRSRPDSLRRRLCDSHRQGAGRSTVRLRTKYMIVIDITP
jgi:hypothetical protein